METNTTEKVLEFVELLQQLSMEDKAVLLSDPCTAELLREYGDLNISGTNVYYLYTLYSHVLTKEMVSTAISDAMYKVFDDGRWNAMGRKSLFGLALERRLELL